MNENTIFLMSVLLFSGCNYMSRTEMGKRALNRKDYPRAAESFSIALQEDRNSAEAYCLRGYSYYKQGMYEKALKDFSRSDELKDSFSVRLSPKLDNFYSKISVNALVLLYSIVCRLQVPK